MHIWVCPRGVHVIPLGSPRSLQIFTPGPPPATYIQALRYTCPLTQTGLQPAAFSENLPSRSSYVSTYTSTYKYSFNK